MEIEGELRRSTISPLLPPIPSERFYSYQASYYPLIVRLLSKIYASPPRELLSLRFYRLPEFEARQPSPCKIFQGTVRMEITFRIIHARYRNEGQLFSRCISSNLCTRRCCGSNEIEIFGFAKILPFEFIDGSSKIASHLELIRICSNEI